MRRPTARLKVEETTLLRCGAIAAPMRVRAAASKAKYVSCVMTAASGA
jgi:hypothetical protein